MREYLRVLLKRKWLILGSVALIFSVVLVATLRTTPIYDAEGSIAVNKMDPAMLNFKDSGGGGFDYYNSADLDTEVRILRSDLLALQVMRQLNLDKPDAAASQPFIKHPVDYRHSSTRLGEGIGIAFWLQI